MVKSVFNLLPSISLKALGSFQTPMLTSESFSALAGCFPVSVPPQSIYTT